MDYSLIVAPGGNMQKSKTLCYTTPKVFSGLNKEDFVKKKILYLEKKTPPRAKNEILVAINFFKPKISVKSTILMSQKTMSIKNKSQYVIDVDGAGL